MPVCRPLSSSASLFLLALVGLSEPACAEQFRYRFQPGQVLQSRVSMAGATMMGQSGGSPFKAQFRAVSRHTQKVRSVADGVATIEVRETPVSGSIKAMGQSESLSQKPTTSVLKLTERGRLVSRKSGKGASTAGPGGFPGMDVLYGLNFPDRDLKPGDTWEDTINTGEGEDAQSVKISGRYVGRELFRGRPCAKFVTVSSAAPPESATAGSASGADFTQNARIAATVTTYFDPAAGVEVYSSGSISMVSKVDLSSVSTQPIQYATAVKVNLIQVLTSGGAPKK
jgi:hypothetical protein